MSELRKYVPAEYSAQEIVFVDDLVDVITRIATFIPPPELFTLFLEDSKKPNPHIKFPMCRVDAELVECMNALVLLKTPPDDSYFLKWYNFASRAAFQAVVWVEVGFEGIENLAESPASRNWTTGIGHFLNDTERAEAIKTRGKIWYEEKLHEFTRFRKTRRITDDYFSRYSATHLLERFKQDQ